MFFFNNILAAFPNSIQLEKKEKRKQEFSSHLWILTHERERHENYFHCSSIISSSFVLRELFRYYIFYSKDNLKNESCSGLKSKSYSYFFLNTKRIKHRPKIRKVLLNPVQQIGELLLIDIKSAYIYVCFWNWVSPI